MDEGLFKTAAVGGFKKSDVLAYIDEMDSRSKENEKKKNDEINKLKKQLEESGAKYSELEAKAKELENVIEQEKKASAEIVAQKKELSDEIDLYKSEMTKKDETIDNLRRDALLLRQSINETHGDVSKKDAEIANLKKQTDELTGKVAEMNRSEDQISRVMLEARNTADKMISDARQECENVKNQAYDKLHNLSGIVASYQREIVTIREHLNSFFSTSDGMLETLTYSALDLEKILNSTGGEKPAESEECEGADDACPFRPADEDGNRDNQAGEDNTEK